MNLEVGKIVVFTEKSNVFSYFKEETVVIQLTSIDDDGDYWADNLNPENLNDWCNGFSKVCVGNGTWALTEPTTEQIKKVINLKK